MTNTSTVTPEPSPAWLAFRVLDEPTRVFESLVRRPRALLPVLLLIIASIVVVYGIPTSVMRSATEERLKAMEQSRPGLVTPEMRAKAMEQAGTSGRHVIAGVAVAGSLVSLLVVSAVLMLAFNALSGAGIKFREEWSLVAHAYMPQVIGALATLVGIIMVEDAQFRVSLGFLVSEDTSRFLHNFANQVTVFGAWNVYLLAVAHQVRTRDRSIATPMLLVGGLWMSVNLIGAILGTVFAAFM